MEAFPGTRFVTGVFLVVKTSPFLDSLADYPPWLVAAVLTVAAAVAIWLLAKLVKWVLWLLLIAVVAGGCVTALWLLLQ